MKHAGKNSLKELESMLKEIRKFTALKEKKPGIFYRKSSAFLHFHEDPSGLYADFRVKTGWKRFRVNTRIEKKELINKVRTALR